jgi:CRP/FNR family transcriptional regulator
MQAAFSALGPHASLVRAGRGQTVSLASDSSEAVFVVRSGTLTLHVTMPGTRRQVIALLFAGDVLRSSFAPPLSQATLTSVGASELWRLRWTAFEDLAAADPALTRCVHDALAAQMARYAVHVAAIGQFTGEQRVATVLVELALRSGLGTSGGGIEMPLSRKDIADYLGLNADTVSRIMSQLRSAGILGRCDRNRAVIRDFGALAALSPAARSLSEIHRDRRGEMLPSKRD